ncbi:MAG: hypothetical protein K8S00_03655 [Bacteroidales bacterium]|nr:hypothetical protein [Bacteroidales bacterium]
MRVIYNTCFADPWLKVAKKLKEEYGYKPVYWNGYEDDDSKRLVPQYFPDVIYHPYFDAWKGIFPKEIEDRFAQSYLNINFLKDYATYELQAIKMMDRMDPDRHSFSFTERQRHFRNMLKFWTACINYLKPDLVISAIVPHRVYDYALYLLCKFNNIKYATFRDSAFSERIIPVTDVTSIGNILDKDYFSIYHSNVEPHALKENLDKNILERYEKVKKDYTLAEPDYMKQNVVLHKQMSGFFPLVKKYINDRYFKKNEFLVNGINTYHKQRGKSIEKSQINTFKYSIIKLNANTYRKKLKKHYRSLVVEPDFNHPYIIVNLHYQPEMTSNPSGDIFVDQRMCVEVLAKHLPSDYLIYVKEHPSQFFAHGEGHTSRTLEFYDDLTRYSQVRLMPLNYDPFTLIRNSQAVATITGTTGWEAMVLGKPVIIFGLSWYEKYSGVLKVVDERTASGISQFIQNFKFDEKDLLAYLSAFSKMSVKAYYYRGLKHRMNQPEDECVDNLAGSIIKIASNA